MEKKKIKCPKCNTVLEVTNPNGEATMHFVCPVCNASLRVNFKPATPAKPATPVTPIEEDGKTVIQQNTSPQFTSFALELNGTRFTLVPGRNTVGRKANSSNATLQLPITDRRMSRSHAVITVYGDSQGVKYATISDDNSLNATKVNNKQLDNGETIVLKPGDKIALGPVTVTFVAQ